MRKTKLFSQLKRHMKVTDNKRPEKILKKKEYLRNCNVATEGRRREEWSGLINQTGGAGYGGDCRGVRAEVRAAEVKGLS